jgi:hypothetical protein
MIFPPGIIMNELPQKNKYTNFKDITTSIVSQIDKNKLGKFMNIIKSNYLRNGDNIFSPKEKNVISYFIGHNHPCFISFYNEKEMLNDDKITSLIKYLEKRGFTISKESYYFNLDYSLLESNFRIKFYSAEGKLNFRSDRYIPRKKGEQRIETMKVSLNRKDYKTGFLKTVQKIQAHLKPEAEKEYIQIVEKKKYASEIEEYFMDKYGATSIDITPLQQMPSEDREILVRYNDTDKTINQTIWLQGGKYYLKEEETNFKKKIIFFEKSLN